MTARYLALSEGLSRADRMFRCRLRSVTVASRPT